MGKSRASKDQLNESGTVSRRQHHAEGDSVNGREEDYRNALNYEMHSGGDSVGRDNHWIEDAHVKKGRLHSALHVPQGEKIPNSKLEKAEHSRNPHMRKMAQFAENVKR